MKLFPVADAHCDFLYGAMQSSYDISARKRGQVISLDALQKGNVALQFFAAWIDTTLRTSPLHQCIAMIDAYRRMLAANPVLTPLDPAFQPGNGRIATVLAVEGGEACEGSMAVLRTLYRLGVRAMSLTWNENNELAGAALARGRQRIGIAVDLAHANDRVIDEILARAKAPVFASHSNARAIYDSPRSLSNEHIRAIAAQGGVIGVNFFYKQLGPANVACINDIVRHICHIVRVGGIDCCAIGSDFDGMQTYPADLKSSADFPLLLRALAEVGFSDEEVYKISYGNLFRYIVQFV